MNETVYWILTGGGIVILYTLLALFASILRKAEERTRRDWSHGEAEDAATSGVPGCSGDTRNNCNK